MPVAIPISISKNKPIDKAIRIDKNFTERFDWPLSFIMEYNAPPRLARISTKKVIMMYFMILIPCLISVLE